MSADHNKQDGAFPFQPFLPCSNYTYIHNITPLNADNINGDENNMRSTKG